MHKNVERILSPINSSELNWQETIPTKRQPDIAENLDFGQFLRRERTLRGISRIEVMRVTKVNEKYIQALETNQLKLLPPKTFVIGFLRVFARYAGMDSEEVINRFLIEVEKQDTSLSLKQNKMNFFQKHAKKILALCGLAGLLALMFFPLLS